ncbi:MULTISPECIES: hypothetical protein [unclassified Streptomyces]|uniref:hypothetical protein n=1 Tax=unclassified Streptomyces TaxID=2593676 RepID=UPI002ED5DA6E|nr:hypothetical protein OH827_15840 [Streptomyces sp. NBC_00891]WSY06391.1 hypothetical protein OG464_15840 [Streptomyces sp. NBC_00890]WSZ08015.1 hypothetical protein OG704_15840 [Streptomyces sp. NBC_00869]WSZ24485.1 hypothetical protein OG498_17725 [Streptomyces sp. NBC_00870]
MSTTTDTTAAPDHALARTVTDVLQPRNVLLVGMLAIGLAAAGEWTGLLWGLLGALCAGIVPAGYIEWERGRGTWGDRHVVDRTKRAPIFFVILGSIGAGSAVMLLGGAPTGILTAMLALWAMTVVLLAVNTVWKISVDASVASAVIALLAAVHSPWWLLGYAMTAAVAWSRVALGYHTVGQVTAGTALGAATAGAFLFG